MDMLSGQYLGSFIRSLEEEYHRRRVVVTGGLGFLGQNLVRWLLNFGANVVIVDRQNLSINGGIVTDFPNTATGDVEYVCADIRDMDQMGRLVGNCDVLFSLAGKSGAADSIRDPFSDLEVNCRGHLTILEAARKYNPAIRLIFPSSRLVYKPTDRLPVDEMARTEPASIYGIHKLAGEKYYLLYNQLYGIQCTILRIANPYGPYQDANDRSFGVVNKFIASAVADNPITIFGDGSQLRDYIYVDDVIFVMLLSAISDSAGGKVINVGSGRGISMAQMAELIVRIAGKGDVRYVSWPAEYANIETGSFVADIQNLERVLSYSPRVDIESGLTISIEYYKQAKALLSGR